MFHYTGEEPMSFQQKSGDAYKDQEIVWPLLKTLVVSSDRILTNNQSQKIVASDYEEDRLREDDGDSVNLTMTMRMEYNDDDEDKDKDDNVEAENQVLSWTAIVQPPLPVTENGKTLRKQRKFF